MAFVRARQREPRIARESARSPRAVGLLARGHVRCQFGEARATEPGRLAARRPGDLRPWGLACPPAVAGLCDPAGASGPGWLSGDVASPAIPNPGPPAPVLPLSGAEQPVALDACSSRLRQGSGGHGLSRVAL